MTMHIVLYAAALAGASVNQPRDSSPHRRCDISSLSNIFHHPTRYFGKMFCGHALILRDGRGLKVFPPTRRLPRDRNGVVMILDDNTETEIGRIRGTSFRFYLEGVITGMEECFDTPQPGYSNSCEPIRYPLFIHVSRFRRER